MPLAEVTCRADPEPGAPTTPSGSLTGVSWKPTGDLNLAGWVRAGTRLGAIGRAANWWIGDWLRFGNEKFGERYARAARVTGYDPQTLMNMVYVATRYHVSQRRENLAWSHHAEVAALDSDERERWLEWAEAERLSVRCLREEIRRARRSGSLKVDSTIAVESARDLVCPECGCHFARDKAVVATREDNSALSRPA